MSAGEALAAQLAKQGIGNDDVLAAIASVPREAFVLPDCALRAYENNALPIAAGQTISQPFIVALMTEYLLAASRPMRNVLEIGTGSGYQAAVLAQCVEQVFSLERIETLALQAAHVLSRLYPEKLTNGSLQLRFGDGHCGWPEHAPFDGIIITAAAPAVPPELLAQLAEGGRLVAPIGEANGQYIHVITREGDSMHTCRTESVRFVALKPGTQP